MARKVFKKKKMSLWIKIIVLLFAVIACDLAWYSFVVNIKQYEKKNPKKTAFMKYRERAVERKRPENGSQADMGSSEFDFNRCPQSGCGRRGCKVLDA